ncbi:hypothetical protein Psfp_02191 [Pelotomaculum sp. FP]|uniref:Hsp20/alpha crystallin family protein n=1 Tax=Pelotomaculum sp. FP TaxID=261474 RepID=UPI001066E0D9|nr:Hsp20/alpha crystallin family protein [Pelotomaculum sp. FP]TEB15406.1 hypothetical protein Psfp_02191 [Pelotomaculum sp. FP]
MKNDSDGGILGSILRGIGEMVDLVQKLDSEGNTEINRMGTFGNLTDRKRLGGCYGFTLKTGLPGKKPPVACDTMPSGAQQDIIFKNSDPVIDVFDEGHFVRVVVEIPTVSYEDIVLHIKENILYLTVWAKDEPFNKSITLPHRVKPGTMRRSIRNGILEVLLDVQD